METSDEMVSKIEEFWFNGNRELAVLLASQMEHLFVLMPFHCKIWDNPYLFAHRSGRHPEVNAFGCPTISSPDFNQYAWVKNHATTRKTSKGISRSTLCFGRGNQTWSVWEHHHYMEMSSVSRLRDSEMSQPMSQKMFHFDL